MKLSVIANALGYEAEEYKEIEIKRLISDSRKIVDGDLFVPIIGENFDGHDFIDDAIKNGASALISSKNIKVNIPVLKVDDTVEAFLKIAGAYRDFYNVKLVAVTGSVGKTSTKEVVYGVLSKLGKTLKNEGNLNNEIGVPMTLQKLDESYKYAVIEMGMDDLGQIDRLAKVCKPDLAIITNIGTSHIGRLGSRENIYKAKTEVLPYIKSETVIVCGDDDFLGTRLKGNYPNVITYGENIQNEIVVSDIDVRRMSFKAKSKRDNYEVSYSLNGRHNAINALAAIAVGEYFGLDKKEIEEGIADSSLTGSRMKLIRNKDKIIIDDCYNASYESIKTALDFFDEVISGSGATILGDVFEMGDFSREGHQKIGKAAANSKANICVFIGKDSKYAYEEASKICGKKLYYYESVETFLNEIDVVKHCRSFLLKASRGMHFERIVRRLENEFNS